MTTKYHGIFCFYKTFSGNHSHQWMEKVYLPFPFIKVYVSPAKKFRKVLNSSFSVD